ncbi:hypothetical protein EON65_41270 [archaeon]|nr:MAG: hypothetical protein EON65_41270 [archaeon]
MEGIALDTLQEMLHRLVTLFGTRHHSLQIKLIQRINWIRSAPTLGFILPLIYFYQIAERARLVCKSYAFYCTLP